MMKQRRTEIEMYVAGLVLDPNTSAPIVILKDTNSDTCLPIWIGLAEATSIASALKKVDIQRPMTHDLLKNTIEILGARVGKVAIVDLVDNTFYAKVELRLGEEIKVLDARPSDALALAVRLEVPIYVNKDVLDRAQATLIPVDASGAPVGTIGEFITSDDEAMSKEEEFVSSIANNPDELVEQRIVPFAELDKDTLKEILADMDPEDFKYKM